METLLRWLKINAADYTPKIVNDENTLRTHDSRNDACSYCGCKYMDVIVCLAIYLIHSYYLSGLYVVRLSQVNRTVFCIL